MPINDEVLHGPLIVSSDDDIAVEQIRAPGGGGRIDRFGSSFKGNLRGNKYWDKKMSCPSLPPCSQRDSSSLPQNTHGQATIQKTHHFPINRSFFTIAGITTLTGVTLTMDAGATTGGAVAMNREQIKKMSEADKEMELRANRAKALLAERHIGLKTNQVRERHAMRWFGPLYIPSVPLLRLPLFLHVFQPNITFPSHYIMPIIIRRNVTRGKCSSKPT